MKTSFYTIVVLAVLILSSCSSDGDNNVRKNIILSNEEISLVDAQNKFGYSVFKKQVLEYSEESNVAFSPLGLSLSLSMAANGATDETLSEILSLYNLSDINSLNEINIKSISQLPSLDKKSKIYFANSAWVDNDFPVKESYINFLYSGYKAECKNVDMNSNTSKDLINSWCARNTNNKITNFLSSPIGSYMLLMSAGYFEGEWQTPFDKSQTTTDVFNNIDNTNSSVQMMHRNFISGITSTSQFDILSLPYGNGAFEMLLYLPKKGFSLEQAVNQYDLSSSNVESDFYKVKLSLPKFIINYDSESSLNRILFDLGVKRAFTSEADFSNISDKKISITDVKQVATISVDENKTVASSVSKVDFGETAPLIKGEFDFNLNRPFMFAIQENSTKIILYIGVINKL